MNYNFFKVGQNTRGKFVILASLNKKHWVGFGTSFFNTEADATAAIARI